MLNSAMLVKQLSNRYTYVERHRYRLTRFQSSGETFRKIRSGLIVWDPSSLPSIDQQSEQWGDLVDYAFALT